MKAYQGTLLSLVLAASILTACGAKPGAATAQATPDLCAQPYIRVGAGQINIYTQQFDDEAALAKTVGMAQLPTYLETLQGIRRAAANQAVPSCLVQLKQLQLAQMNTTINTMLSFLGGADAQGVAQAMAAAQQQHDQYVLELARILDVTPTIETPPPTSDVTATPGATETPETPVAQQEPGSPPPAGIVAVNPGPYPINLRKTPSPYGKLVTTLDVGKSVIAIATTGDGTWLQVLVPGGSGELAWVLATDVRLSTVTP